MDAARRGRTTSEAREAGSVVEVDGCRYRPNQMIVAFDQADAAVREMRRLGIDMAAPPEPLPDLGVVRVHLDEDPSAMRVPDLVRHLRRQLGLAVAVNAVFEPASHIVVRPATPPAPGPELSALPTDGNLAGRGVLVGVVDSGAWSHPWFGGCVELGDDDWEADDKGAPRDVHQGTLRRFAGHGTFISGVILQHAPGATVLARRVTSTNPAHDVDDVQLGRQMLRLAGVDVLSLSLGTRAPMHDDDDFFGLMTTANSIIELRRRNPELVIIAPAGNDGSDAKMWPAAFNSVISVAALAADGQHRAAFSNYGSWVDASAKGEDVESTFLHWNGPLEAPEGFSGDPGSAEFQGWATWSGTSFAVPRVAGAIAALMGEGIGPAEAVAIILRGPGARRIPGCGTVVDPPRYVFPID